MSDEEWKTRAQRALRILFYLSCTVTGLYQSGKSVKLFFSYPTSTTFGEGPVTYDEFPYLVMCKRSKFWDPKGQLTNISKVRFDSFLFGSLLRTNIQMMERFPWDTVTLEEYHKAFTIEEPHIVTNKPKKIYENYQIKKYDNTSTLIYSIYHGMCQYTKPWLYEQDVSPGSIEITAADLEGSVQSFMYNIDQVNNCFFGLLPYRETFVITQFQERRSYTVSVTKRKRLPLAGYHCIESDEYNQMKCWETCVLKAWYYHANATCQLPWIKSDRNLPTCNNYKDFLQTVKIIQNKTFYTTMIQDCEANCPDSCTTVTYKKHQIIPIGTGKVHVHFKFESKMQIIEEDRAYRFINMFGDIGGIMGIFIGISIFGLYEEGVVLLQKIKKNKQTSDDVDPLFIKMEERTKEMEVETKATT